MISLQDVITEQTLQWAWEAFVEEENISQPNLMFELDMFVFGFCFVETTAKERRVIMEWYEKHTKIPNISEHQIRPIFI